MELGRVIAREATRKIFVNGKLRAYWGPWGIARLIGKTGDVLGREGWRGVLERLRQMSERTATGLSYAKWAAAEEREIGAARARYEALVAGLRARPLVSVVMPTYNSNVGWLREAIESVRAQYYPYWELCIADDASPRPEVRALLAEYASSEPRIRVAYRATNGHISAATNTALGLANGEFISLMDHDDVIPPHALAELVACVDKDPAVDMVYSDEDKLDLRGQRFDPFFKPDWSPDYLESCMYTAHVALYRKSLVDRLGGFRSECNGAQDYDFVLRFTELTDRIAHVPLVLYHWRAVPGSTAAAMEHKGYVVEAGQPPLQDRNAPTRRSGTAGLFPIAACLYSL
jgi:hypothetical protein